MKTPPPSHSSSKYHAPTTPGTVSTIEEKLAVPKNQNKADRTEQQLDGLGPHLVHNN